MENYRLSALFKIEGLGAASGLFYRGNHLYIISDSSSFLYQYNIETAVLERIKLIGDSHENIAKAEKPDFEAISYYNGSLYLFGSGSTFRRNRLFQVDVATKQVVTVLDLRNLYAAMQERAQLPAEDFNIEAALFDGKCWLLFNRGNGKTNKNIIFTIDDITLKEHFKIDFIAYNLPAINGISSSFTDAIFIDNKIYFLATAEDTNSTYDDGEVFGSLLGQIDRETMEIKGTVKISDSLKLEGLTSYSNSEQLMEFLICEDNDSETLESTIYKVVIEKGSLRNDIK